tara:strand:- start:761 stop:1507 length:747 start_codon:yes stop_codon:yes gene_type:complete
MLSIIIITKNEEEYLPRLLKSVKDQMYKDYEIILSDAYSIDRTIEIAENYNCKIIKGGLPSIGRNNGGKVAQGDLLLFLDADVEMPKDFLNNTVKEFKKRNLGTAVPHCRPISDKKIDKLLHYLYNKWALLTQYFYPHGIGFCIFVKKDIFNKMNGFKENIFFAEDHDFVNRSQKYGKFRILKKTSISVDVRRLDKEGRLNLIKKYFQAILYRIFKGEIYEPSFEYELQGGIEIKSEAKKINEKNKSY